jgi:hypothetical protein
LTKATKFSGGTIWMPVLPEDNLCDFRFVILDFGLVVWVKMFRNRDLTLI